VYVRHFNLTLTCTSTDCF